MTGGGWEVIGRARALLEGKWGLIVGAGLALLALTALIVTLTRPAMVPLFTGLSLEDAAAIVDRLAAENVPYRIGERGDTILVPASQLHEVRLMVAREGLPTGGVVGLEIFNGSSWSSTDLDREVRLVQALQGELTRTILQVRGVVKARVHLVLPKESIFAGQARPAAAAVMVQLRPGHSLSREQVAAITHLVAGAVPDLAADRVTLLDASGRLLSAGGTALEGPGLLHSQAEAREYLESRLATETQALLEQVLGPGNALVTVRVDLDFDAREKEQVLLQPSATPLIRSMQEIREVFQGTGSPPGGLAGTASNLPGASIPVYASISDPSSQSEYQRTETLVNYEINQTLERVVTAPGAVSRLSAAVVVNRNLTVAEEEAVSRLVSASLGLNPSRGDGLVVLGMPFDTSLADRLLEGWDPAPPSPPALPLPALAAAAAILVLTVVLVAIRSRRRRVTRLAPRARAAAAAAEEGLTVPRAWPAAPALAGDRETWSDLADLARQKPEAVARLLRTWISEN